MKTQAAYCGSFDPPTNGHLHVLRTASKIFNKLYVIISKNPKKRSTFTAQERQKMLQDAIIDLNLHNVEVVISDQDEFIVRHAAELDCQFLVRGLRNASDLEDETAISDVNSIAAPNVETLLLLSPQNLANISSSMVKGLVGLHGWRSVVRQMVPKATMQALECNQAHELYAQFRGIGVTFDFDLGDLISRYNKSFRHYHNIGHIVDCLEWFKLASNHYKIYIKESSVLPALWFHDIVYNPLAHDNEENSAERAMLEIGKFSHVCRPTKIKALIQATAKHFDPEFNPADFETQLMLDIDIASFAANKSEQEFFSRAIRQEYSDIPDNIYKTTRAKLLSSLLAKPRIYRTDFFYDKCETLARGNIIRELETLRGI